MTDPTEYRCAVCGFALWLPLASLDVSTLAFYDDARYPGRCLLALHDHHEHFAELPAELTGRFVADAQRAGRAIQRAVGAERMNFAILGNVEQHVHFHLIPRGAESDPVPGESPWSTDVRGDPLPPSEREGIMSRIREALEAEFEHQGAGRPHRVPPT
jgi:diadenosine tetraphosphate (Ap4A) HIT family hydrolase